MATHYIEFDTNAQMLFQDLRTQILTSTDWARLTPSTILLNTSGATVANATTLPFAATGSSGLAVGSVIAIDDGTLREYRTITAITATQITVAALTFAHATSTPIRWGNELYKATTTRGAQMVVDLNDVPLTVTGFNLAMAVYQAHDGTTGTGKALRYLYWRVSAGAATHPLHVILSLGKEHFFLSIEGPRPGDTGAVSATVGSQRNYMFLSDLVPYDVGDAAPVVVAGGSPTPNADAAVSNFSHLAHTSRNLAGTSFWAPTRLMTLDLPKSGNSDILNAQRQRAADGKFILSPYVGFLDDTGMRGRLSSFFFAGHNMPSDGYDVSAPVAGSKVEYQGNWYKLLVLNKSDGSRLTWGQLGAANNATASTALRSCVAAVPCLP